MRKNKTVFSFYSFLLICCTFVSFYWNKVALADSTSSSSSSSNDTILPSFCPLGEPLRSSRGELIICNCPPRPFCPMLYYCKTEVHGQNGICCPDFGVDRTYRHKIKPEDSRIPLYGSSTSGNERPCFTSCPTDAHKSPVSPSAPGNDNSESKATQETAMESEPSKKNCPPIKLTDIQPLPSKKCVYEESQPDSNGCPRPPKISCPSSPKECKPFPMPMVGPGCTIGPETFDENGCPLQPQVTCETTEATTIRPTIEPQAPGTVPRETEAVPPPVIVPYSPGTKAVKEPPATTRQYTTTTRKYTAPTYAPSPPPCPTYKVPPTLSPDCEIAPPRKDEFGCLLPPEIRCQKKPTTYAAIVQEKMAESMSNSNFSPTKNGEKSQYGMKTQCPQVTVPEVQPGCKLLPSKYDSNGCMLVPEITCDPTIINAKRCPLITLPKMDPLCTFGPDRNDSDGCPMVPEIICPVTPESLGLPTTVYIPEPVTVQPHNIPRILSHCPYVAPPYLPPGCVYGTAKYDEHGCSIAPEVICRHNNPYENENENFLGNGGASVPMARRFSDMLTAEFYHMARSTIAPDANEFRRSIAIPVVTAGKFRACRIHAECFHYREPREWCQTSSPQSQSVWTEKSCHCAEDTMIPACIVERMNRGVREWTFCADYAQCVNQN